MNEPAETAVRDRGLLDRLARFCYHRRRIVLAMWVIVLVGMTLLGNTFAGEPSSNFTIPGSDFQKAQDLLKSAGAGFAGARGEIVIQSDAGLSDPELRRQLESVFAEVGQVDLVVAVNSPFDPANPRAATQVSDDGTIAFAELSFDSESQEALKAPSDEVRAIVERSGIEGVRMELSGFMFQVREPPGATEGIGLIAAVVILLLSFGSVLAMGLPIITALFGIGIGLSAVSLLSNVMSMPDFASQLAAMIGIGVGIDYALFIVTRYRTALHAGRSPEEAVALAIRTSGKAVLFAGVTVVISLLGMFLIGIEFLKGLATGASLAVGVTMLASVTLLPAVMGFVGHKIDSLALPWARKSVTTERNIWFRWSRIVQKRPLVMALVGLAILLGLAWPALSIRLGSSDAGNLPTTDTTRRAYDLISEGFGPGTNGPFIIAIEAPAGVTFGQLQQISTEIGADPGVAKVTPAIPIKGRITELMSAAPPAEPGRVPDLSAFAGVALTDDTIAQVIVTPTTSPQDEATVELFKRLQSDVIPAAVTGTGIRAYVGGATSAFEELSTVLQERLPIFIGAVLTLSFFLLMGVFRSVMVPLKAVIMNLLSIGAAYGVLVLVFQKGLTLGLDVGREGPIESFVPMMMFAIIFGLSMDYEVFLLSRIKEEYDRTGDNSTAVADGLSHTARVITAAAAIMICVFGSFIFGEGRVIKEFGLGLAVAVLIDATIVRMILVPATMELLGKANWWLPKWLDRLIPKISIEGNADDHDGPAGPPAQPERELAGAGV